jgi:hypothetical protein
MIEFTKEFTALANELAFSQTDTRALYLLIDGQCFQQASTLFGDDVKKFFDKEKGTWKIIPIDSGFDGFIEKLEEVGFGAYGLEDFEKAGFIVLNRPSLRLVYPNLVKLKLNMDNVVREIVDYYRECQSKTDNEGKRYISRLDTFLTKRYL